MRSAERSAHRFAASLVGLGLAASCPSVGCRSEPSDRATASVTSSTSAAPARSVDPRPPELPIADQPFGGMEEGRPFVPVSALATSNGRHGFRLHLSNAPRDCEHATGSSRTQLGLERTVLVDVGEWTLPDGSRASHVLNANTASMPSGLDPSARMRFSTFDATAGGRIEGALAIRVEHSQGVPPDWPTPLVAEGRLSITACGPIARKAAERRQSVALSVGGEEIAVRGAILERSTRAGWLWLTLSSEPLDCTDDRPMADARIILNLDDRSTCDSASLFGNLFEPQRTIGGVGLLDCRVTGDNEGRSYRVAATSTDGRAVVRIEGVVEPLDCRR